MTPFAQYFYPIFGAGILIAAMASFVAGRASGYVIPILGNVVGVLAFWAGLFIGSEIGYQKWQATPNPPAVAFNDTMPMGALLAGWMPASVFCGFVFGATKATSYLFSLNRTRPSYMPSREAPEETGNPYQGPQG